MSHLAQEIRDAEARVARLKQQATAATCAELGEHDWKLMGGRNAYCGDAECSDCQCSVPVNTCARCGACDYGESAEAAAIVAGCLHREGLIDA